MTLIQEIRRYNVPLIVGILVLFLWAIIANEQGALTIGSVAEHDVDSLVFKDKQSGNCYRTADSAVIARVIGVRLIRKNVMEKFPSRYNVRLYIEGGITVSGGMSSGDIMIDGQRYHMSGASQLEDLIDSLAACRTAGLPYYPTGPVPLEFRGYGDD